MEPNDLFNVLRAVLELGWPAIVMIAIYALWRHHVRVLESWKDDYIKLQAEYIASLREVAGLRPGLARPVAPPAKLPEEG